MEDGVREGLPALFGVRIGLVGADGEGGVEPENAGFRKGCKVSGMGSGKTRAENKRYEGQRLDMRSGGEKKATNPVLGGVKSGISLASCL